MVKYGKITKIIEIPENIKSVKVDNSVITVKGNLGSLVKDLKHTNIQIIKDENKIIMSVNFPRKSQKALIGSVNAHIKNMFIGVTYGFQYHLKIVFSHFPIRVSATGKKVKIENLYGGRSPRFAQILGKAKVTVEDEDVIVKGIDIEDVGQTAANIQELTRQRGKRRKSPKTFMDGIFTYKRATQIAIDD